ncbi:MAG: SIS domain-containing protein, partial [Bacteroidales bacterium]|nr:SIS domain-containing protein [Bacteroidales bacterium]
MITSQYIFDEFNDHQDVLKKTIEELENDIEEAGELIVSTLKAGNKVLLFGNGGSAGDAQHIAAELTGRYKTERQGLPAIALTTDTSAITAIGND